MKLLVLCEFTACFRYVHPATMYGTVGFGTTAGCKYLGDVAIRDDSIMQA
jgi:hypothetical protein